MFVFLHQLCHLLFDLCKILQHLLSFFPMTVLPAPDMTPAVRSAPAPFSPLSAAICDASFYIFLYLGDSGSQLLICISDFPCGCIKHIFSVLHMGKKPSSSCARFLIRTSVSCFCFFFPNITCPPLHLFYNFFPVFSMESAIIFHLQLQIFISLIKINLCCIHHRK